MKNQRRAQQEFLFAVAPPEKKLQALVVQESQDWDIPLVDPAARRRIKTAPIKDLLLAKDTLRHQGIGRSKEEEEALLKAVQAELVLRGTTKETS